MKTIPLGFNKLNLYFAHTNFVDSVLRLRFRYLLGRFKTNICLRGCNLQFLRPSCLKSLVLAIRGSFGRSFTAILAPKPRRKLVNFSLSFRTSRKVNVPSLSFSIVLSLFHTHFFPLENLSLSKKNSMLFYVTYLVITKPLYSVKQAWLVWISRSGSAPVGAWESHLCATRKPGFCSCTESHSDYSEFHSYFSLYFFFFFGRSFRKPFWCVCFDLNRFTLIPLDSDEEKIKK